MQNETGERKPTQARWLDILLPMAVGTVLVAWFWFPLWNGAGFLGGDVYNYFMPLKAYYAEGLKAGEIRYWHPKIGNGVSVLGESQTGAFYPFHLIAYRLLDVVPAYNAVFLLHYVLAFVFCYWLARDRSFGRWPSLLAAFIFVYAWFAPRACLEWSITTGCWLPLQLLFLFRWLETGRRKWGWSLSAVLFVQLLAGHYQLAWVSIVGMALAAVIHKTTWKRRFAAGFFVVFGVLLAAPQLLPTWELKSLSKRNEAGFASEVSYGRIPPKYLVQMVWPLVYEDPDGWLKWSGGDSNRIEAHFTLGSVPTLLLIGGLIFGGWKRDRKWWLLFALAMLLATGLPFVVLKHVPGFSFFRYPGRYSLIAALAGAFIIARLVESIADKRWWSFLIVLAIGTPTALEYFWSSRAVGYAAVVKPPPMEQVARSEVFRRLTPSDRVLAPDGNTLALSPAACVRPYIGLEPEIYFRIWNDVPDVFKGETTATPALISKLQQSGVTHILTEQPLPKNWPVTLAWSGYDAFLHPRWGRNPNEPLYLYNFDAAFGLAYLEKDPKPLPVQITSGRIVVEIPPGTPEGSQLRVTEWRCDGDEKRRTNWEAVSDGKRLKIDLNDSMMRVELPAHAKMVEFTYRPYAFFVGFAVGALAMLVAFGYEAFNRSRAAV